MLVFLKKFFADRHEQKYRELYPEDFKELDDYKQEFEANQNKGIAEAHYDFSSSSSYYLGLASEAEAKMNIVLKRLREKGYRGT